MTRTHDRGQRRGAWSSPHGRAHGGSRCPRDGPLSTAPMGCRRWGEEPSPPAKTLVLVRDHRHPHPPAARYETCVPAEARRLMARWEGHHTPKPGRWRQRAETALRVLARPCVARRMPDPTTLHQEVAAWPPRRHQAKGTVDWRFTTPEASIKLQRLDPSMQRG